jgi:hypothetical protein
MCESVGSYFEALVAGQNPFKYKFGAAVRGLNMDIGSDKMTCKDRKMSWLDETDKDTWLYDMKMKDGSAINAGCAWDLVAFTGGSNTFEGAVNKCYKAAEGFSFSNMIYRPKFDFMSDDYQTSIPNRYNEGIKEGLFNGKIIGEEDSTKEEKSVINQSDVAEEVKKQILAILEQ